jgi:hypothetical protein
LFEYRVIETSKKMVEVNRESVDMPAAYHAKSTVPASSSVTSRKPVKYGYGFKPYRRCR